MDKQPIDWEKYWELVRRSSRIVLTSHVRPDGDSLGSQTAMGEVLAGMGKKVMMINSDPVPPTLRFLDPENRIRPLAELSDAERAEMAEADLFVSLDTSARAQLGKIFDTFVESKAVKAVIDHHVQRNDFPANFFVDSDAPATGSLVFDAVQAAGIPLTEPVAFKIFVALATDTGWFRFASVTAETYRMVAALVEAGVRPDEAYRIIYERESLGRMRLIGKALAKTESLFDGRLMFTSLLLSDFAEAGAHKSESEDIVNLTLQVADSRLAIIMVEQTGGGFKISFRSRCAIDCSQLAAGFGGGGHQAAAGAFLAESYEKSREMLLDAIEKAIAEHHI